LVSRSTATGACQILLVLIQTLDMQKEPKGIESGFIHTINSLAMGELYYHQLWPCVTVARYFMGYLFCAQAPDRLVNSNEIKTEQQRCTENLGAE
jgi:hypothetical protein